MKTHHALLFLSGAALAATPFLAAQTQDILTAGWRSQVVDTVYDPAQISPHVSLGLSSGGNPVLAYADYGNSRIEVATRAGSAWSYEVVGSHDAALSLAMDANDKPTFAWTYNNLFFSAKPATKWSTATVDRSIVENRVLPSLAYDGAGNPAVSYRVRNNGTEGVGFAWRTGSTWKSSLIDGRSAGAYYTYGYTSLAFDPVDGRATIVYVDDVNDDGGIDTIRLAKNTDTGWSIETVEAGILSYGGSVSLAYFDGRPVIADCVNGSVRLLRKQADGSWLEQIIDSALRCDLCIKDGKAFLAYVSDRKLKVASAVLPLVAGVPANWTIQVADSDATSNGKPSIKVGSDNLPQVGIFVRGEVRLAKEDPTYPGPSFLFQDDMESGLHTWIAEGDKNDPTAQTKPPGSNDPVDGNLWHSTTRRGGDAGHSPQTSWYYGIDAQNNYNSGTRNWGRLVSEGITIPAGARAQLNVSQLVSVEGGSYESADVQVRVLPSGAWTTLSKRATRSTTFSTDYVDLTPYLGKTIQIGFFLDTKNSIGNQYEGWYLDDVNVKWWP